ncbi:MAG: cytidine deaminase [Defluviitaleaceae bacterium]|nr:cytidine deaminase [Defluviitaleaceae bacterium]
MDNEKIKNLIENAIEARQMAYVPYSGFKVGAALLSVCGAIFKGCNVENAAYSPTNCAERTAFCSAIVQGAKNFTAIAIVGGAEDTLAENCFPCGVCRQVMMEFCEQDFMIIIAIRPDDYKIFTLSELLPHGFGPANLTKSLAKALNIC